LEVNVNIANNIWGNGEKEREVLSLDILLFLSTEEEYSDPRPGEPREYFLLLLLPLLSPGTFPLITQS
jgi:hypothetical protein